MLQDFFRKSREDYLDTLHTSKNKLSNNEVEQVIEHFFMDDLRLNWLNEEDNDNCLRSFVVDICKALPEDPYYVYAMTFMPQLLAEKYIFICKRMPMNQDQYFCLDVGPLFEQHRKKVAGSKGDGSLQDKDLKLLITLVDIFWMPLDQVLLVFSLEYFKDPYYFACVARLDQSARTLDGKVFPHFGFIDLNKPVIENKTRSSSKSMLETHVIELGFKDAGRF